VPDEVLDAFGALIADAARDRAFAARTLTPPTLSTLNQELATVDFESTFLAREAFIAALAARHAEALRAHYETLRADGYTRDQAAIARREFRNLCLRYLAYTEGGCDETAFAQFTEADNMTDCLAALGVLCQGDGPRRTEALDAFYAKWRDNFNVGNKWFALQASSKRAGTYDDVLRLAHDPIFDARNPNRLRSLYGVFTGNLVHFHAASGRGYRLIADQVLAIDRFNNLTAAGLAKAFKHYARLDPGRRALMKTELERIASARDLSTGVREVVENTLR
jgi:aminopeptidase N